MTGNRAHIPHGFPHHGLTLGILSVHIFLSLTLNITRNPCSPVTYSRLILRSTGETGPKAYGRGRGGIRREQSERPTVRVKKHRVTK